VRLRPAGGSASTAASILGLAQQQIGPFTPTLSAAATISGDSVAAAQLLMGVNVIPPWSDRAPIDVGAVVALYGIAAGDRGQSRALYVRQHLLYDSRGYWIGGAIGQIVRRSSFASNMVDVGGWLVRGNARFTAMISTTGTTDREVFQHTALEPDAFAERARVADGSLSMAYLRNRLELEATVGGRVAIEGLSGSRMFATGSIGWRVTRIARVILSGGSQLADPLRGTPEWRYVGVGVRLSKSPTGSAIPRGPAAPPVRAVRLTDGLVQFTVSAPFEAETVELAATFTGWQAVAVQREGETWGLTMRVPAGAHQVRVRINGGDWRVPVNLTPGRDDFGYRYGVIIIP
jgi:hypothetical protein